MNLFYSKFAWNNIRKNKRFVIPYMLSAIFTIGIFYILASLAFNPTLTDLSQGASAVQQVLGLGIFVVGIFAVIFLFYTYSFLVKRRIKEFGLYAVLGMTKKQIAKMLCLETIYIGFITLATGLLFGVIFDKLSFLILSKMLDAKVVLGFNITWVALILTVLLFGGIYFLILMYTIIKISSLKIVNLLGEASSGEKEPKSKWIFTLIGLVLIGFGYYTAISVENPITAITTFFYAVIAVIIGTYFLFTSISIAVLKLMKNNKKFYYKPKNFISVSGMLYRMKRNAVGLANICVLSTMVLVMIGSTSSLYVGSEDIINKMYPRDISISRYKTALEGQKEIETIINASVKDAKATKTDELSYTYASMLGRKEGEVITGDFSWGANGTTIIGIALADYEKISGKKEVLEKGEILLSIQRGKFPENKLSIDDKVTYNIKKKVTDMPNLSADVNLTDTYYIVVRDGEELKNLSKVMMASQSKTALEETDPFLVANYSFNVDKNEKEVVDNYKKLLSLKNAESADTITQKSESASVIRGFYSSFLFIGVFISLVFTVSQTIIMYYKQISEGYEDKGKFEIMKKVGLTDKQIKKSINSQILMMFFAPLIVAAIHVLVATPFIEKIMKLFSLNDTKLFMITMGGTFAVFAIFYTITYIITSRVYYKIVK